jgi:hypothetical protein
MQWKKAAVLLSALALPGCAVWSTQLPATTEVLDKAPRVDNSPQSPCWQQRQIAKQNAYFDSIKTKKDLAYQAPCDAGSKVAQAKR